MIVKPNEKLAPYTTFKIGGATPNMHIPETSQELISLVKDFKEKNKKYYILANGSNILINDQGIKTDVINTRKACSFIDFNDQSIIEVGSSVKLAEFIRICIDNDLKIFTKLITIPGTVGGALYMNAGRNKEEISNNLLSVKIFDGKQIKELNKEDCRFSHRYSVFHKHKDWVILSARYNFRHQSKEQGLGQISEELQLAKRFSYFKYPSTGSIFKNKHDFIMKILKGVKIGNAGYSKTDDNSILNLGNAKFKDIVILINLAKFLHFITFQKCTLEIEIWK